MLVLFFFNDTATTEIYPLSLHDALPIWLGMLLCYDKLFPEAARALALDGAEIVACPAAWPVDRVAPADEVDRSEEHTSELQSRQYLVCRLLLEKKKQPPADHRPLVLGTR